VNYSDIQKFVEPNEESEVTEIAKQIAAHFKQCCKAQSPWKNPFNPQIPPEHQTAFKHCIKAAELILEIRETDPVDVGSFVQAQFEGLAWAGNLPWLSQLHSFGARKRYDMYLAKRKASRGRQVQRSDYQTLEEFGPEDRKAESLASRMGVSIKRVLKSMPREFSEAYLRHRGVWSSVSSQFGE